MSFHRRLKKMVSRHRQFVPDSVRVTQPVRTYLKRLHVLMRGQKMMRYLSNGVMCVVWPDPILSMSPTFPRWSNLDPHASGVSILRYYLVMKKWSAKQVPRSPPRDRKQHRATTSKAFLVMFNRIADIFLYSFITGVMWFNRNTQETK